MAGYAAVGDEAGRADVHLGLGREAVACYTLAVALAVALALALALALARQVGDSYLQAALLHGTGDVFAANGEMGKARTAWWEALALLDDLRHDDAEEVRYKLRHS
jgi:predicted negative regulator of RcsB-dependent stress response